MKTTIKMPRKRVALINICTSYFIQRFDNEVTFELPNETSENIRLNGKYMYFLSMKCIGETHNFQKDGCGKVEIHNFARSVRPLPLPAEIYTESGIGVSLLRVRVLVM